MNWVSTKDQLPEPQKHVIVYGRITLTHVGPLKSFNKPFVHVGFRFEDKDVSLYIGDDDRAPLSARWIILTAYGNAYYDPSHITYWQPMPEPPVTS